MSYEHGCVPSAARGSDTHVVCVVLTLEFHKAIALVLAGDSVLGQVHIDCRLAKSLSMNSNKGMIMILDEPIGASHEHKVRAGPWVNEHVLCDAVSPRGPAWMKSSHTVSSESCTSRLPTYTVASWFLSCACWPIRLAPTPAVIRPPATEAIFGVLCYTREVGLDSALRQCVKRPDGYHNVPALTFRLFS